MDALLGSTLLAAQKYGEAEPVIREALAIRESKLPDDWRTSNTQSMLGATLLGQHKYAEAEPLLVSGYEGLVRLEATLPVDAKPRLQEALERLAQLCAATGRADQAAAWNQKLAELQLKQTGQLREVSEPPKNAP